MHHRFRQRANQIRIEKKYFLITRCFLFFFLPCLICPFLFYVVCHLSIYIHIYIYVSYKSFTSIHITKHTNNQTKNKTNLNSVFSFRYRIDSRFGGRNTSLETRFDSSLYRFYIDDYFNELNSQTLAQICNHTQTLLCK